MWLDKCRGRHKGGKRTRVLQCSLSARHGGTIGNSQGHFLSPALLHTSFLVQSAAFWPLNLCTVDSFCQRSQHVSVTSTSVWLGKLQDHLQSLVKQNKRALAEGSSAATTAATSSPEGRAPLGPTETDPATAQASNKGRGEGRRRAFGVVSDSEKNVRRSRLE